MRKLFRPRALLLLSSSLLAIASGSCSRTLTSVAPSPTLPASTPSPTTNLNVSAESSPQNDLGAASATSSSTEVERPDTYQLAIDRASSAFTISQSAQSQDDWRLVASRWQQAIDLLETVPNSNPEHATAQTKLTDYRRNLAYAQQQASRPIPLPSSGTIVVNPQSVQPRAIAAAPTQSFPSSSTSGSGSNSASSSGSSRSFRVPIVRRAGGTPVINVVFNGNQSFPMIVDTGASGTLITRSMAAALQVVPVGQANVATASSSSVTFPLGYVNSIQVDGAVSRDVLVAVAGPELEVGLLGHDFFGTYDVTIGQNHVEFRER